jgi:hypothetical protein
VPKVWIVLAGDEEGHDIQGVFATKELADAEVARIKQLVDEGAVAFHSVFAYEWALAHA